MIYILVDPDNKLTRWERGDNINPEVMTKPGWRWLPLREGDKPKYSPKLQTIHDRLVVTDTEVVKEYYILDKSDKQIEDDKRHMVNDITIAPLRALLELYNKLHPNAQLTEAEYREHIRKLL